MSFKIPSVPKSHNPTIPKSHNPRIPPDARLGVQKPEPALTQPHPLQLNPSRAPLFHFPLPDKNLQRPQNHSRRRECGVFPPPSQRSPWKCREAPNPAGASSLHVLWCLPRPRGFWDPPLVSLFFFSKPDPVPFIFGASRSCFSSSLEFFPAGTMETKSVPPQVESGAGKRLPRGENLGIFPALESS